MVFFDISPVERPYRTVPTTSPAGYYLVPTQTRRDDRSAHTRTRDTPSKRLVYLHAPGPSTNKPIHPQGTADHPKSTQSAAALLPDMAGKGENSKKAAGNARKAEQAAKKAAEENAKLAQAEAAEWSKGTKSNAKK